MSDNNNEQVVAPSTTSQEQSNDSAQIVDKMQERIGLITRQKHEQETKAKELEKQIALKDAELAAERAEKQELERLRQQEAMRAEEASLKAQFPNAAKFLDENPELGLAEVENLEQYKAKMQALEGRLSGGGQEQQQPAAQQEQAQPSFVASNAQGAPSTPQAPQSAEDIRNMSYQDMKNMSDSDRMELLRKFGG